MTLTVCTGFSPTGYRQYGARFLETFDRHWPRSVRLIVYTEQRTPLPRGENRIIWDIPDCADFLTRHERNEYASGKLKHPKWADRHADKGYNFRFDAFKFCRQAFIPLRAAQEINKTGLLCWLDADVITFKNIPQGFIESLLPKGFDLAYLGRNGTHSEIGFQLYRLPEAVSMVRAFSDCYARDAVFNLDEWHSAYVFDHCRKTTGVRAHNMTPGGSGHVWFQSPLCEYMDHLKGARKSVGRSLERKC